MNRWKKSKAGNYQISRNGHTYTVLPSKYKVGTFTLMIAGTGLGNSFIIVDGDNMVDAVRSATLWIKSRMESQAA